MGWRLGGYKYGRGLGSCNPSIWHLPRTPPVRANTTHLPNLDTTHARHQHKHRPRPTQSKQRFVAWGFAGAPHILSHLVTPMTQISHTHIAQRPDPIADLRSFGGSLPRAKLQRGRHMGAWCSTTIVPRGQRRRRCPRPRRLVHGQTLQQRPPVGQVPPATWVLLRVPHACASNCVVVGPPPAPHWPMC